MISLDLEVAVLNPREHVRLFGPAPGGGVDLAAPIRRMPASRRRDESGYQEAAYQCVPYQGRECAAGYQEVPYQCLAYQEALEPLTIQSRRRFGSGLLAVAVSTGDALGGESETLVIDLPVLDQPRPAGEVLVAAGGTLQLREWPNV